MGPAEGAEGARAQLWVPLGRVVPCQRLSRMSQLNAVWLSWILPSPNQLLLSHGPYGNPSESPR